MESEFGEELKCQACRQQYSSASGDPRTMGCGHSLCTSCLEKMIKTGSDSEIECHECKTKMSCATIDDVPISYTIKQIIDKLRRLKDEKENPKTFNRNIEIKKPLEVTNDLLCDFGTCNIHKSPIHFGCMQCENWLCGTCVCLKHAGDQNQCQLLHIREALQKKKEEIAEHLYQRKTDLNKTKTEGKSSNAEADILATEAAKLVTIGEKYFKEFTLTQLALVERETYIVECEALVADITEKLRGTKSLKDIKEILDGYFEKKAFITKNTDNSNLLRIWKNWTADTTEFLERTNRLYVKWKDLQEKDYWMQLSLQDKDVILRMLPENNSLPESRLIIEETFFKYSSLLHYAFISLESNSGINHGRLSFVLDDSPLGEAFMKRCCYTEHSFKGSKIRQPYENNRCVVFGDSKEIISKNMIDIGNKEQYLKPFIQGGIGLYSNLEHGDNKVDVNHMEIYISVNEDVTWNERIPFISYEERPKLKLCFGITHEGLGNIEYLNMRYSDDCSYIISDCGIIADQHIVFEDEEE